jgi:ATP-dependent RNA helicase DeaD
MLKIIERATGQPIAVEKLPTVADLRARRLELLGTALRGSLLEDDLDAFRSVVEPLGQEFGLVEVALAAIKLAHETGGTPDGDEEIPAVELPADERYGRRKPAERGKRRGRPAAQDTTRLFVGSGRSSGVRPKDLVGAITSESYLSGGDIGAIEIADRFSLVEVPESAADDVVAALRRTSIKGRKTTIRRERQPVR